MDTEQIRKVQTLRGIAGMQQANPWLDLGWRILQIGEDVSEEFREPYLVLGWPGNLPAPEPPPDRGRWAQSPPPTP